MKKKRKPIKAVLPKRKKGKKAAPAKQARPPMKNKKPKKLVTTPSGKIILTNRETVLGNQWYLLRSKHGRDKLFASPEMMWQAALEYFEWCELNPDKKAELVKYEGYAQEVEVSIRRPYTIYDVCRYLDCNTEYFVHFKRAIQAKPDAQRTKEDRDFCQVIGAIEESIKAQQIRGAMNGFFNSNLVARLNNIADRQDVTSGDKPLVTPEIKVYNVGPPLAGSEEEVLP